MSNRSSRHSRLFPGAPDDSKLGGTLADLRHRLERAFHPDTAAPGFKGSAPSTGHCAAASLLLSELLGARMVSTKLQGQSHWLNRLRFGDHEYDFDLTGDQYGFEPIMYARAEHLYEGVRIRSAAEVNSETVERAIRMAARAGFSHVALALRRRIKAHTSKPVAARTPDV